ncbi:YncE family protein [Belliella marina]|uniref:YncE family protein n=1 Tax=Belliella marina TaxID=1644146 RepID=A0ABW4VQG4_9BACT
MKNFRLLGYLFALSLFIYSCDSSRDERPLGEYEKGLLIINEGNFSSRDGDISHYNFNTGDVQQNIFEKVNSRPFAGIIQDIVEFEDYFYLVANTGKVEIVDKITFKSLGSVGGNTEDNENPELIQPRSAIVADNKIYIADHGPYDDSWANPESYIAIVNDKMGGDVVEKIETSSRPEKLYRINNDILIACTAARKIDVLGIGDDAISKSIEIPGTPAEFLEFDGKLLLFSRNSNTVFFHEINKSDYSISNTTEISIANPTSNIALGENGEAYIITRDGSNNLVSKISISSGQVINANFFEGSRFYGIGYDKVDKYVYVADNNGFQGSGTVMVINQNGEEVKKITSGAAPSGFIFRR